MSIKPVHSDLVSVALERADGGSFERFCHQFYPAIAGGTFIPLGGMRDGGADAFDSDVREDAARPSRFFQASVEAGVEGKIRRTVARLREFGRHPRTLVFLTPHTVRYLDRVEGMLTAELDVVVAVRDGAFIRAHVNDSPQTVAAFEHHLRQHTEFLKAVGRSTLVPASVHVKSPAVYVFLAGELARRDGDFRLVDAMTDALILWALEGTDPDRGVRRSAAQLLARIETELPGVRQVVAERLPERLEAMAAKSYPGGRAIRAYRKEGMYCLPYDTRCRIESESAADDALRVAFRASVESRIRTQFDDAGALTTERAVDVVQRAVQVTFETQGLEFASFLARPGAEVGGFPSISDALRRVLSESALGGRAATQVGEIALFALRGVIYDSCRAERDYLHKLSLTYALLFTLNAEPRLVEYFQELTGDFYLYVGTDVLLRALSEHHLPQPDRVTRNTLLIAARQGARLVLTQSVLDEIVHHLRACEREYVLHMMGMDGGMAPEIIRTVPHIMLRAYLYAHTNAELGRDRPASWAAFVNIFCDHADLLVDDVYGDLRRYLCSAFGMEFRSDKELARYVDEDEVAEIAGSLAKDKRRDILARHDAMLVSAVYGRRAARRETSNTSEFGLSTWWLTGETAILRHTREQVRKNGAHYVMRPDFLLNFLTLAPKAADSRVTFRNVFPGLLGVSLGRRMEMGAFHALMSQVAEAQMLDDARRAARIAKIIDHLKGDATRQFLVGEDGDRIDRVAGRRRAC